MSTQINHKCGKAVNMLTVKIVYKIVDMGQRKSRQLSVRLLGFDIQRSWGRAERNAEIFLEFVDIANILLHSPHW